jgi:hypothetical protein
MWWRIYPDGSRKDLGITCEYTFEATCPDGGSGSGLYTGGDNIGDDGGGDYTGGSGPSGGGDAPCGDPIHGCMTDIRDKKIYIDGEPCAGNPVEQPRIAAQKTHSGIDGGRFRVGDNAVRTFENGDPKDHKGLDIENNLGDNIYSTHSGRVYYLGNDPEGWGNFALIESTIENEKVSILIAHLGDFNVNQGDYISAGTVIGSAGVSGNLADAISEGTAIQHTHIEFRKKENGFYFNKSEPLDPEEFITTKFNTDGTVIPETDC